MTRIHLDHVTKTYPARSRGGTAKTALPDLDLVVEDGEFLVLVGPSGCGKSTALRLVAGLEEVSEGVIRFDDVDVTHRTAAQRNIAFVFQNYALYPHMTVAENIGFPLRMAGLPRADVDERVRRAAAMLRLTEQLGRRPSGISGGQAQRVAMGRAIVREPDVFLMDEPLSNLDTVLRVEMRAEIAARQQELGKTTVYVTHDGEEAMTMGHRVAVLRDGLLQQVGPPDVVWREPRNAFVAGFVGYPQMNFLATRLALTPEGAWSLARGAFTIPLADDVVARHPRLREQAGEPVIVGIRPEDVRPSAEGRPGTWLEVTVTAVQHLGSQTRILFVPEPIGAPALHVPDLDVVTNKVGRSGELVMTVPASVSTSVGDNLRVELDARAVHLFDGRGERL